MISLISMMMIRPSTLGHVFNGSGTNSSTKLGKYMHGITHVYAHGIVIYKSQ